MAKNKKRKNVHALFHAVQKKRSTENDNNNNNNNNNNSNNSNNDGLSTTATATATATTDVISDADMATTVNVLQILLAADPDRLQSKACKDLRKALHPLVLRQLQNYEPVDYLKRVTLALHHQKWSDAVAALQGARDYQQLPKQGTIQRWVRDADGAGDCKMKLLSAILRLGNNVSSGNKHDVGQVVAQQVAAGENLTILEGWTVPNTNDDTKLEQTLELPAPRHLESRIVYQEEAAHRTPPNMHDLLLHATLPGCITYSDTPSQVLRHDIPFLQGGFLLDRVLTPSECHQFQYVATQLGFRPDHPVTASKPTGIDSCEWFVDHSITHELFRRVQPHLPPTLQGGHVALHHLNARFRCFRYAQDCVYRPHIDGSWPESRLDVDGKYDCGSSGSGAGKQGYAKSYFTFLIYLNDDFEGGETRFYMPTEDGMVARGVVPKRGSVLVFPQGNTCSLIHEGSAVTSGTKYVIRTDVLYRQQEEADAI